MTAGGDPAERFDGRVALYLKHRPRYPSRLLDVLRRDAGLTRDAVVADVGSGTGLLSELFLDNGNVVYCVEPNPEMRAAAEGRLGRYPGFRAVPGRAEATTLPDRSVSVVAAAQAFHWFEPSAARTEFARILVPDGMVALVWNRRLTATPFEQAYERLLRDFGTDYEKVRHENIGEEDLAAFFGASPRRAELPNNQDLSYEGLEGRLLSASYMPAAGDPRCEPVVRELRGLFRRYERGRRVRLGYQTEVFWGRLV